MLTLHRAGRRADLERGHEIWHHPLARPQIGHALAMAVGLRGAGVGHRSDRGGPPDSAA